MFCDNEVTVLKKLQICRSSNFEKLGGHFSTAVDISTHEENILARR